MDDRDKDFLIQKIARAQGYIDAIREDFKNGLYSSYYDECCASDEIMFQEVIIKKAEAELASV